MARNGTHDMKGKTKHAPKKKGLPLGKRLAKGIFIFLVLCRLGASGLWSSGRPTPDGGTGNGEMKKYVFPLTSTNAVTPVIRNYGISFLLLDLHLIIFKNAHKGINTWICFIFPNNTGQTAASFKRITVDIFQFVRNRNFRQTTTSFKVFKVFGLLSMK